MKPMKMKHYADFDAYYADQSPADQAILHLLRRFVKKQLPKLAESVKWGNGCWLQGDAPVCYVHTGPGTVQFGFFMGSNLKDPAGLLEGKGKYVRFITLSSLADFKAKATAALLKQAAPVKRSRAAGS